MLRPSLLAIALTTTAMPAIADETLPMETVEAIADQLRHFGFTHVTEFEAEEHSRATVEGWRHPDWHSELTWSIETGQGLEEELEYGIEAPWGIRPAAISRLVEWMARDVALARIASLEIEPDGEIELEGEDAAGEPVTRRARLEAFPDRP